MKKLLLFVFLTLIVLVGCDTDEEPVIIGESPAWSPDGSTIAYRRPPLTMEDTAGIWLIDTNGTNNRYLCSGLSADWSPDGERLVVATPDWNICLIDKDGSNFEYLVHDWSSNSPAWSPDGKWVTFTRPYGTSSIINIETREERTIPGGGGYGWSPDSKELVYMYLPGSCYLKVVTLEDTSVRDILTILQQDLDKYGAMYPPPRWSPDGEKILFVLGRHVCVVDTSGKNLRKLAKDGLNPYWSPDGERIVYTNLGEGEELWIMNANGWNKHPLGEE